jgi:hypothetical protein
LLLLRLLLLDRRTALRWQRLPFQFVRLSFKRLGVLQQPCSVGRQ